MNFDISRLRRSYRIIGAGAIAFFIFLFFFKWYGVSSNVSSVAGVSVNDSRSGWSVFTNSRWIWLITIIVALAAVVIASGALKFQSPVQPAVAVAALGALSSILILYRILHHPTASASFGTFHASAGIKIGIWLGLIAAIAVTYGGYLAMTEEGTSLADVRDQASGALGNFNPSGGSSSSGASRGSSSSGASSPVAPTPPPPPPGSATTPTTGPPTTTPVEPTGPPLPPPASSGPSGGSPSEA